MFKYIFFIAFFITSSFAQIDANLEIVKKANTLPKILISIATDSSEIATLNKIKNSLAKDLEISGHFELIKEDSSITYEQIPDILALSNKGVDLYLNISAKKDNSGKYTLFSKLFDINSQAMILEKSFTTLKENRYPFLAHRSAISINDYFKAPSIAWMDKFVVLSVYKGSGKADIVIGDYTLKFKKTIISGGLNIFPKWANKNQRSIYYTSYNYNNPTLVKVNIYTRQKEIIMQSEGMIAASDVNSDGSKVLITASPNSQPDIYLYNASNKSKRKVTSYSGIDVGGQFIDNDSRMVFVSDRLGYPNIFAKSFNSRGVEKLVYHSRNNSSATSFNDNIVYVSKDNDNELSTRAFNLYLMSTKSDDLKRLTASGINQFPKFSPDGESLLFIKSYKGHSSIGIIRLNFNKSYLFELRGGKIQSIDW
ncbi:Tol-Pal system protein TolB [Poseidonibacter lekithochrous]|uniref:Tol-Pal system protein TolB n=1 Tax=Poseidonibacter lekithochrous TaxID=1904463 RepID=UPI0008FC712C|nr:Tol-Pal system protein TolB [Poseidonibacter lekithochrous]QKJ23884.1 Tol-Pal system translocation protein TolB [Poseidonibacter lekithochrous]